MSLLKSAYNLMYKCTNKAQNEPKNVFSDVEVEVEKGIAVDETGKCKVDVWMPKERAEKFPVLFYTHGGSFVSGGAYYSRGLSKWVAQMGYAVVTVDYELAPSAHLFEQLKQVASALNWVQQNAEKYGFDLSRVVAGGDSAGGYLSAMTTALSCDKELQKKFGVDFDMRFHAAWYNCALFDFNQMLEKGLTKFIVKILTKEVLGYKFKDCFSVEPKEFWSITDNINADFPPCFLTYSKKDSVCPNQTERFMERLDELGVHHESYHSTKFSDNHCFSLNWKSEASKQNNALVAQFLKKTAQLGE